MPKTNIRCTRYNTVQGQLDISFDSSVKLDDWSHNHDYPLKLSYSNSRVNGYEIHLNISLRCPSNFTINWTAHATCNLTSQNPSSPSPSSHLSAAAVSTHPRTHQCWAAHQCPASEVECIPVDRNSRQTGYENRWNESPASLLPWILTWNQSPSDLITQHFKYKHIYIAVCVASKSEVWDGRY